MQNLQKEYERIKKYVSKINVAEYDLYKSELEAISDCCPDKYEMIVLAFKLGFAKGCRKTRKAVKDND